MLNFCVAVTLQSTKFGFGDLFSGYPPYQLLFWSAIINVNVRLPHVWLHSLPTVTFEQKPARVAYPAVYPLPLPADGPAACPSLSPTALPVSYPAIYLIAYPTARPATYPAPLPEPLPEPLLAAHPAAFPSAHPSTRPAPRPAQATYQLIAWIPKPYSV